MWVVDVYWWLGWWRGSGHVILKGTSTDALKYVCAHHAIAILNTFLTVGKCYQKRGLDFVASIALQQQQRPLAHTK